jgi:holo-[acyl-carrier protein] synthase
MKISIGTDIIEVKRIQKILEKGKTNFLNSVYTEKEIEYCEARKIQKYQSYAVRFAAKEAIYKAINEHIGKDYSWKDFEIINEPNGKPKVNLKIKVDNLESIEISLSHCKEYAVAYVTAIYKEN